MCFTLTGLSRPGQPAAAARRSSRTAAHPRRGMLPRMTAPFDTEAALRRLQDLLSISGPTGEEAAVAGHVVGVLREAGLPPELILRDDAASRIPVPCQCGNVIIRLPGTV